MMPIALILMALLIAGCQPTTDRQWPESQRVIELTQPRK